MTEIKTGTYVRESLLNSASTVKAFVIENPSVQVISINIAFDDMETVLGAWIVTITYKER